MKSLATPKNPAAAWPTNDLLRLSLSNLLALAATLAIAACGDDSSRVCEPGEVQNCACSGGAQQGVQTCADDGEGWLACTQCGTAENDAVSDDRINEADAWEGQCSITKEPCGSWAPCPTPADLLGKCIIRDNNMQAMCLYNSFNQLAPDVTCGPHTVISCVNEEDCPAGAQCSGLGTDFCPAGEVSGLCNLQTESMQCQDDEDCTIQVENVCVE